MIKMLKRYSSYFLLVLLSIGLSLYYSDEVFYFGVKYITSFRAIDIMFSILFSFLIFKIYLDNYYYIVLNRNNIITRLGRKKYHLLIISKLLFHSTLITILNILIDFLLMGNVNLLFLLFNIILSVVSVIFLPKRKEYNNELLIIMIVMVIIKIVAYKVLYFN